MTTKAAIAAALVRLAQGDDTAGDALALLAAALSHDSATTSAVLLAVAAALRK